MKYPYLLQFRTDTGGVEKHTKEIIELDIDLKQVKQQSTEAYLKCLFILFAADCPLKNGINFEVNIENHLEFSVSGTYQVDDVAHIQLSPELLSSYAEHDHSITISGVDALKDWYAMIDPVTLSQYDFEVLKKHLPFYNPQLTAQTNALLLKTISTMGIAA